MARGRPKGSKNKPKQVQLFQETVETNVSEPETSVEVNLPAVDTPKEKPIKVNGYCTRCGKAIYSGVIKINRCALTGNATWSRACSVDKLILCNECSKQLNEVVDNWVISENPKLKKPYHIS